MVTISASGKFDLNTQVVFSLLGRTLRDQATVQTLNSGLVHF
jgi:hypothetical protein